MRRKDRAFVPSVETVYKKSAHNADTLFQHVLRFIVLLTAVIGMNVAANGMLGLKADHGVMILAALYAFSVFYFIFRSVKGIIAGALILVLGMLGILFITDLSLKEFFEANGFKTKDSRPIGCLWVVGEKDVLEPFIQEAESAFGVKGNYGQGRTIGNKNGWWTKEQK